MASKTTAKTLVAASANFATQGTPDCVANPDDVSCLAFTKGASYTFAFTGATVWTCLDPSQCGVPSEIFPLTVTDKVPSIFQSADVWTNASIAPSGISVNSAPPEVVRALNAGLFNQCLTWNTGMSIPALKFDPASGTSAGPLPHYPYMCGPTQAYLIKDPVAASQISPAAFFKLSTDAQTKNGAYDTTTHVATLAQPFDAIKNPFNPIPNDPFNPQVGRYSSSYDPKISYQYGQVVNQANRVYVCNSANCSSQPILDISGSIWSYQPLQQAPPSRQINIDQNYSNTKNYFKNDMAAQQGSWYVCTTPDVLVTKQGQSNYTNLCNTGSFILGQNLSWTFVALTTDIDVSQPIQASPFSPYINYSLGDYYADTKNQKVYKCTGSDAIQSSEILCHKPYSPQLGGWTDVTYSGTGNTSVYNSDFANRKASMSYYKTWVNSAKYLQGDVVFHKNNYYLCTDSSLCSSTDPLATLQTVWNLFDFTYGAANKLWSIYDVNSINIDQAPQQSYLNFNNGIICIDKETATTNYLDRICASANSPTDVVICNKIDGCIASDVATLPQTRDVGYPTPVDISDDTLQTLIGSTPSIYFNYIANQKFNKFDIVLIIDSDGNGVFWQVGPFDPIGAMYYGPYDTQNNGIWLQQGQLTNTGFLAATELLPATKRSCKDLGIVNWYGQMVAQFGSSAYWVNSAQYLIGKDDFACDQDTVYKCDDLKLCNYFMPQDAPEIWSYQGTMIPDPIVVTDPLGSIVLTYKYSEFANDVFNVGNIAIIPDPSDQSKYLGFTCIAQNNYACTKYLPGDTTTENLADSLAAWQSTDVSGKIIWAYSPIDPSQSLKPFGSKTSVTFGRKVSGSSQVIWSQLKDARYASFTFEYYDPTSSDDGFVFYCLLPADCKITDPTLPTQQAWLMSDTQICTSAAVIQVAQPLNGDIWLQGYPYLPGDVICDSFGNVYTVVDGFAASFQSVSDNSSNFSSVYNQLNSKYFTCNPTPRRTPAVVQAKSFADLVTFNPADGTYSTIKPNDNCFVQGRIFQCIQNCASWKPTNSASAWKLTGLQGSQIIQQAVAFAATAPALPSCISDDFATGSYLSYVLSPSLSVTTGSVCSTDPETQRKMAAGNPEYINILSTPMSNLPYNMVVYKTAIPDQFINLATATRDVTIKKENIETAFASFPLFCGDAALGDDVLSSCKKDIVGFFTYVMTKDIRAQDNYDATTAFWQYGFDNVIDKDCYALADAVQNGLDVSALNGSSAVNGKTLQMCNYWGNPKQNFAMGQFPEYQDAFYFSRGGGPLALTGAQDYGQFSQVLLGNKLILLQNPSLAEDPRLTACIAMWSYMSYGRNGSSAPSIHDIFTGHWSPNAAESSSGLLATEPINAALSVIVSQLDKTGKKSCKDGTWFQLSQTSVGINTIGDAAFQFAKMIDLVMNTSQDIQCAGVGPYPQAAGPNAGLFLAWDTATSKCILSATPTTYHAYRAGDVKQCIVDGTSNFNYVKASQTLKSSTIQYTDWQANYPYLVGDYASDPSPSNASKHTAYKCLQALDCAITPASANAPLTWGTVQAGSGQWYDQTLLVPADQLPCVFWSKINSSTNYNPSFINLISQTQIQYVCDGQPGQASRVFTCMAASQSICLDQANKPSDLNLGTIWTVYQAIGHDQTALKPALICADTLRFTGDYTASFWWYDWTDIEFKNFGSVCSYDIQKIQSISEGFIEPNFTTTGLTDEQLAITTACSGAACTQISQVPKQTIWTDFNTQVLAKIASSDATTSENGTSLKNFGTIQTDGSVVWQYAVPPFFYTAEDEYPFLQAPLVAKAPSQLL